MRAVLSSDHRRFFREHGFIEFDGLLSEPDLVLARDAFGQVIQKRRGAPIRPTSRSVQFETFQLGRDVWRQHPGLKKVVCSKRLAEIASDLLDEQKLQLAYDQLFEAGEIESGTLAKQHLAPKLPMGQTLESMSAFQGIVGGVVICLRGEDQIEDDSEAEAEAPKLSDEKPVDVFPKTAGSVLYFRKDLPLDFSMLFSGPSQQNRYLLVVYGCPPVVYVANENDAHAHELKDLHYVFGDRLKETTHPVVTMR